MTDLAKKIPGYDLLGYTYDIRGEYASPNSTIKCVASAMSIFDGATIPDDIDTTSCSDSSGDSIPITWVNSVGSATYCCPEICSVQSMESSDTYTVYGRTFSTFTSNYGAHFGLKARCGAFKGSLSADFSSSARGSIDNQYYTIVDKESCWIVRFNDPTGISLDSTFESDLSSLSSSSTEAEAKTFFNTYGTHLVVGIVVGGQRRANYYSSTTSYTTEDSFEFAANAKYNAVAGAARMSTGGYSDDSTTESNVEAESAEHIQGGDTSLTDWTEWAATIPDNPVAVDFVGGSDDSNGSVGLMPIWELCSDSATATWLEDQFESLYQLSWSSSDIILIYAGNSDQATNWTADTPTNGTEGSSVSNLVSFRVDYDLNPSVNKYFTSKQWPAGTSNYTTLVITGFGGTISSSTEHMSLIVVQVTDVNTGNTATYTKTNGGNVTSGDSSTELYSAVPTGAVLTGLGIRDSDNNFNNIRLDYQVIDDTEQEYCYLSQITSSSYLDKTGDTSATTTFDQSISPQQGEPIYALIGIEVKSNTSGVFDTLNVLGVPLGREIDR